MTRVMIEAGVRAVTSAVTVAGASFFTSLAAGSTLRAAEIAAGSAFFGILVVRAGAEGAWDAWQSRQSQTPAPALAPPASNG